MTEINSLSEESWSMRIGRRLRPAIISGLGGFLVIYILSELSATLGVLLLVAPFGASCVLVFALPQSPLAQQSGRAHV